MLPQRIMYYTAARLGANHFAAKLASFARPMMPCCNTTAQNHKTAKRHYPTRSFRNELVACNTENALMFRNLLFLEKQKKGR